MSDFFSVGWSIYIAAATILGLVGCLALLVSILISVFRPGAEKFRELDASALTAGGLSFALSLLYPQALVPIGAALGLYVLLLWWADVYPSVKPKPSSVKLRGPGPATLEGGWPAPGIAPGPFRRSAAP